jgi:hypothetical protein
MLLQWPAELSGIERNLSLVSVFEPQFLGSEIFGHVLASGGII